MVLCGKRENIKHSCRVLKITLYPCARIAEAVLAVNAQILVFRMSLFKMIDSIVADRTIADLLIDVVGGGVAEVGEEGAEGAPLIEQ